jgi:WD40 repeat protein
MPLANRIFRLFISSTFSDFLDEREALQARVFPQLEIYCQERGATFQAVDLRWGITEDAQRQHDTMRICLEEVRRCQQLSPRPNFAVLLGDRYGWEPPPARIPVSHWRSLLAAAAPADRRLITASYRGPDRNAIPPVWHLKARTGSYPQISQREEALREALRRAVDAAGLQGAHRVPYFASATHQEIVLGALDPNYAQDAADHVHVYVRRITGLPQDDSARQFLDWDAQTQQPLAGARERLRALETELRERLPGKVHELHARWAQDRRTDGSHIDAFCDQFLRDQQALIDREIAQVDRGPANAGLHAPLHDAFGQERARDFTGRKPLLRRIARYLERQGEVAPLVVYGEGGLGKSALMAHACAQARHAVDPQAPAIVCVRFIGGVPGCESLYELLGGLVGEITQARGQTAPDPLKDTAAAREAFQQILQASSAERPLVLFVDAVDQLDRADSAWQLDWLPRKLSPHTRVVVSVREGPALVAARWRYPRSLVQIPPMKPREGRQLLAAWLASRREAHYNAGTAPSEGRQLTARQRAAVLDTFAITGKPLWLKLAYEEVRTWASWDAPRPLPDSVEGMVQDLTGRRLFEGEKHPTAFTTRALAYLTAARFGLSDTELGRALASDAAVREEFSAQTEKTGQHWEAADSLPPILWSRLYFDLQPYLTQVQIDGALLYRWFHREFAEEIGKTHLSSPQQRDAIHGGLAEVFAERAPWQADLLEHTQAAAGAQVDALRRIMEQPWQLAAAGRAQALQALLTDFGFCMGKCAANRGDDLLADYGAVRRLVGETLEGPAWHHLMATQGHLLRRGSAAWPAHRILLQVALEHAQDSEATVAALAWLRQGLCDWPRLQRVNRPTHLKDSGCLAVFEGHGARIDGALPLDGQTLLTWSRDATLRTWDLETGTPRETFLGHSKAVAGALLLPGGHILSWSSDRTLAVWEARTGTRLLVLRGHRGSVKGAVLLGPDRALSWSDDGTLRIWDLRLGSQLEVLHGHTRAISGVRQLPHGGLLSWSAKDKTVRLWPQAQDGTSRVLSGHAGEVGGALWVGAERVLSWSGGSASRGRARGDRTLRLWDTRSGQAVWTVSTHTQDIIDVIALSDGSFLSWSRDGTLARWQADDGQLIRRYEGHEDWVTDAFEVNPSTLVSWGRDDTIRAWNLLDGTHTVVEEVARPIWSGRRLDANRFAAWADVLTIWDLRDLTRPLRLQGHAQTITDALTLPDGKVLTWGIDETLRRWDLARVSPSEEVRPPVPGQVYPVRDGVSAPGHCEWVRGALALSQGEVVSWAYDHSLRIWNPGSGHTRCILSGHRYWVMGVVEVPGLRLVSWSDDCDVMVWDLTRGHRIEILQGSRRPDADRAWDDASTHDDFVRGAVVLSPQSLASWADDHTIRIWDLQTLQERHLIALESAPDVVASLDTETFFAWWAEDAVVGLWSTTTGRKIAQIPAAEFSRQYPAQSGQLDISSGETSLVLRARDFEASAAEGALKVTHRQHGDLFWHGERTLDLFCLASDDVLCASMTEKDLAFIRLAAMGARGQ